MGGKRSKRLVRALWMPAGAVCLLLDCQMVRGQSPQPPAVSQTSPSDLTQVSIENLMNMEVTSVSKK